MAEQKIQVGAFLHSFYEANLEASIRAAGKSGLKLPVAQIGPVSDGLLIGNVKPVRDRVARMLKEEGLKVALGCTCFELGPGRSGGEEVYDTIEDIVRTGGLGYIEDDKTDILKQRMAVYKNHLDFLVYLRDQGLISQDKTGLSSHWGFIDREPAQRTQVKEGFTIIAKYAKDRNIYLLMETGTEPIEQTIEFIEEIDLPNIGLNIDLANHILYRTQKPEDVLKGLEDKDFYGKVFGFHAKDAILNAGAQIIGKAEGEWQAADVRFGTGIIPWKELIIPTLYKKGVIVPAIIERESQDIDPAVMKSVAKGSVEEQQLIATARLGDIRTAMNYLLEMKQYVTR